MVKVFRGGLGPVVVLAVVLGASVCEGASARQGARGGGAATIKLGEFPPDFELPVLTLEKDADGKGVGRIDDSKTIRLSSFRGKKPVCLWMSSYT